MLEIGDILLTKDASHPRLPYPIIAIAEDGQGITLYRVRGCGYHTQAQLHERFEHITILEEIDSPAPNGEDE